MLMQQFKKPFKQLEFIALDFRMDPDDRRQLQYAQQFRSHIEGGAIHEKLQCRQVVSASLMHQNNRSAGSGTSSSLVKIR